VFRKQKKNRGLITQKDYTLEELEPKVFEHEQHFSKNLNTEELEQLNRLLEKIQKSVNTIKL
jgi:Skp family chaperone for outer membrane proteins